MTFLAPSYLEYIDFSRWLDSGGRCTELSITAFDGRSATIFLEDNDWHLIVSGGIRGGRKAIKVNRSHDFDVKFTNEGYVLLECWDKSGWGPGTGTILQLELPALSDIDVN